MYMDYSVGTSRMDSAVRWRADKIQAQDKHWVWHTVIDYHKETGEHIVLPHYPLCRVADIPGQDKAVARPG
ncbi:hypothetical protein KDW_51440 [Dictyobacter vulcani]|uniref:Uncharacterized protein n=1 Tax=Dictyobacter vulcani TaxID=2607529 RepID=A0A5J4KUW6_9CHLR|nr:hypothetical protein KDW_51440 [Dictyobacter vulcani]